MSLTGGNVPEPPPRTYGVQCGFYLVREQVAEQHRSRLAGCFEAQEPASVPGLAEQRGHRTRRHYQRNCVAPLLRPPNFWCSRGPSASRFVEFPSSIRCVVTADDVGCHRLHVRSLHARVGPRAVGGRAPLKCPSLSPGFIAAPRQPGHHLVLVRTSYAQAVFPRAGVSIIHRDSRGIDEPARFGA